MTSSGWQTVAAPIPEKAAMTILMISAPAAVMFDVGLLIVGALELCYVDTYDVSRTSTSRSC